MRRKISLFLLYICLACMIVLAFLWTVGYFLLSEDIALVLTFTVFIVFVISYTIALLLY